MHDLSGMVYDEDDEQDFEGAAYWEVLYNFVWAVQEFGTEQVSEDLAKIIPQGTVIYMQ